MALECSMATTLGISSSDPDFVAMCITDISTVKPVIYVNQPTAYFNITNKATFSKLKFSGVNGLAVSDRPKFDFSYIPAKFCTVATEPPGGESQLKLTKSPTTPDTLDLNALGSLTF